MATTTNYSWSTPDDTALVKDGAAAIRSLGTAIDTTVFTNAGAAIAKSIVDAKGDLIAGTADNTVARLASSGSNGNILTVDTSTATGLAWAAPAAGGGFTSLASGSLPASSTLTLSSIVGTYKDLRFICKNFQANGNEDVFINVNSSTIIDSVRVVGQGTGTASTEESTGSANLKVNYNTIKTGDNGNIIVIEFKNYAETSGYKAIFSQCRMLAASGGDKINQVNSFGYPRTTSAISEIVFKLSGSAWNGGTYELWGIN
jgi:hypothetical protein